MLFALLSIPLFVLVDPEIPELLQDVTALPALEQASIGLGLLLTAAFLGFFLYLLNPSFRRRFEDGTIRPLARTWFTRWQRHRAEQLKDKIDSKRADLVSYRLNIRDLVWRAKLKEARATGLNKGTDAPGAGIRDGIEQMERSRAKRELISFSFAASLFDLLCQELRTNDADRVAELDRAHLRFWNLAVYACESFEVDFGRLHYKLQKQFPRDLNNVGPTALANLNRAHQDAIWERYRMNGELFWPIIEQVASSDDKFAEMLRESRLRMDFPISMAAASLLFSAGWLIFLYMRHAPAWVFCLVLFLGPASSIAFYWVAFWNAYTFNATVRMTIDLFRFKALEVLHIQLPASSVDETALWSKLTSLEELSEGHVEFLHEQLASHTQASKAIFE